MGFRVSQADYLRAKWFPVAVTSGPAYYTIYNGQLVQWSGNGFIPMVAATGAAPDVTHYPQGVVIANNNRTPLYSSTYQAEYITSVQSQTAQAARDFFGVEGMWSKSEPQAMVKVVLIDPTTIIEGDIRNAAMATLPGVVTCTTASSDGLTGAVTGAPDCSAFTASNSMYYGRSGNNTGVYRQGYHTTNTSPTFYTAWPHAWAVGDTYVAINFGLGNQLINLPSVGLWLENSAAMTYGYAAFVEEIKLSTAGNETAIFRFTRQGY
jgi:hypothetical protein